MIIKALNDADNAVSDIVGFMLILSIMIASLAIITLYAYPILDKSKDDIYFSNTEQSFTLLHSDTSDITSGRSTIKTRDLNIANAQMIFDPGSTNISICFSTGEPTILYNAGSIEYDIKDRKLCLENGALLSSYGTGSIVINEPHIYIDGETTVINLVQLDGPVFSVGGDDMVHIIQQKNFTESLVYPETNLTITINSQYANGWATYLENQGFTIISTTSGSVTASINETRPMIYGTSIKISPDKVLPVNPPTNVLSAVITTSGTGINVTIHNIGNQNFSSVNARMYCLSGTNTWTEHIGNISAGNTTYWNVSTSILGKFTVTVNGSGTSSLINPPPQYQTRSNQVYRY